LNDEFLVEYDVLDRLSELATAFNKTKNLKQLIKHSIVEMNDPLDELVAESKRKKSLSDFATSLIKSTRQ
jgi:hypothetical protein